MIEKSTAPMKKTEQLARELAEMIKPGDVITLVGPVGAGKSTLVSLILSEYDVEYHGSPTFTLVNRYFIPKLNCNLLHVDLYRSAENSLEDIIEPGNIVFIEWCPNQFLPFLNPKFSVYVNEKHIYTWSKNCYE